MHPLSRLVIACLFLCLNVLFFSCQNETGWSGDEPEEEEYPSEYMFLQRAYPEGYINREAYKAAMLQAAELRRVALSDRGVGTWEPAGPTNVGGRISSLAVDPSDPMTIYAGAASGGIWKSTDEGLTWAPVFDEAPTLSIGDIAVAPSQPQTLFTGTGEANAGGGSLAYDGFGVFKSTDGGESWQHSGLEDVGSIGKVIVHPADPDRVFVAAMGFLFENNPERGVFRTEDGGQTWEKVLFVNDSTGAVDLAFHPANPDIVYAATWERIRKPDRRKYYGFGSCVWRSLDGGDTWEKLAGGFPQDENGRIGLAVTPADPDWLFALVEDKNGSSKGVFRSFDKGTSWQAPPPGGQDISYPGYGWWFGKLYLDPTNGDKVFALGVDLHRSLDGALVFDNIQQPTVHVDHHALYIDPADPDRLVLGNDGGVYISYDGGDNWDFRGNFPITQFYACEIDFQNPQRLLGGAQDNGTWRTLTGALDDYEHIFGGDGFQPAVNPVDPNYVYAEFQYGGLGVSTNGGISFDYVGNQITTRKNWNMPVLLDPADPSIVYGASERLWRSANYGFTWVPISPDLTKGPTGGNLVYASITTIAVSPQNSEVIWVGTDDGNVQVSANDGTTWVKVSDNLPVRWVTRVVADPNDELTAYVTFSGYRYNEYLPHVFKTTDLGATWEDISGNLPEAPANDLIVDPAIPGRLFLATDVGVFETLDDGGNWTIMAPGIPAVPVTDLDFHPLERILVTATYGRSFYKTALGDPVAVKNVFQKNGSLAVSPNPLSGTGRVVLEVAQNQQVTVAAYDMQGCFVFMVYEGRAGAGKRSFSLDSSQFPVSGTYVLRASGERFVQAVKLVVKR